MAKLGTTQRPAVVRVRSQEEAQNIVEFAQDHGWQVIVGVEPDNLEDLTDLHQLMRAEEKQAKEKPRLPPKISGNDYCPCRSGKKFKKCCGAPTTPNSGVSPSA